MAGNSIYGEDKVEEVIKVWEKLEKVVTDNVNILEKYSKTASNLPSQFIKQTEDTRKAQEALNKALEEAKKTQSEYTNLIKAEERLAKKTAKVKADLAVSTSKEAKEYHKLNEAKKAADKANRDEAKSLIKTVGLYNQIQQRINNLTKEYNDLAAKKALGRKLNADEEKQLASLTKRLTGYQNTLKKVDADIGKHQRNVGNYKSAFNGLNTAVAQIGRELPAATVSMQTFFLGISNNIPMLQDEITKLIAKNKELAASGKPTVSIMGQLSKAVFSLTNLLSLGTTLLVIYGKDILDFGAKVLKSSSSADVMAKNIKKINEESANIASQTLPQFQALVNISQDVTKSEKERAEAINKLNKEYPDFNANILTEKDNTELVEKAIDDYIVKLTQKARAQATMDLMQEKYNKLILEEQKLEQQKQNILEQVNAQRKLNNKELFQTQEDAINYLKELDEQFKESSKNVPKSAQASNAYKWSLDGLASSGKELSEIQKEINDLMEIYIDNVDLASDSGGGGNGKRDAIKALGFKSVGETQKEFQDYASKVMKILEENFGVEAGKIDPIKLPPLDAGDFKEGLTQLQIETNKFIENLSFKSIDNSPISSIATFFDGTFDRLMTGADTLEEEFAITFNAISNVAQDAFNFISQLGQENFEAEYNRLAKQRDVAIQFAGESTAAKKQVEEQYEARRAAIQTRQAKAEKEQALFKIGIDTAQAIVASIAKSPETFGLPFSAFAAAAGALQAGLVASQKIPQFWMGTESTPAGQIMVNDDPFGIKGNNYREVVKEPSGKLRFPQGKNVKMNVPKGSKVYPTYTDFNEELDNMLNFNGVLPFKDSIVTDLPTITVNNQGATAADFDRILSKHFSNIQINQTNIDERGFTKKILKGNAATTIHNNRTSFKGFSV